MADKERQLPRTNNPLVLRMDFSDQRAWEAVLRTIQSPGEHGFMANADFLDDPAYRELTSEQIMMLLPPDYPHGLLALVDMITIRSAEMPLLVIDLAEKPGRSIRVVATQFWGIENNISISNMDFEDFAEAVDQDGIFRGS